MNLYIGVMSGTSMDSVDAVLTKIDDACVTVIAHHAHDIPKLTRARLSLALNTASLSAIEAWQLDAALGALFADSVNALLATQHISAAQISAIGSHGQTLFHAPESEPELTIQIADPNIIAYRTGIITVADFRRMDMAAGGQGAPLAPSFHAFAFSHPTLTRAVLNIGGIANLTVLPLRTQPVAPQPKVIGFDTGPGNTLLDGWVREHLSRAYDDGGHWAASGTVVPTLLNAAMSDAYFARRPPKSTGLEYFNRSWLDNLLAQHPHLQAVDVQRTLCELTACSAANALKAHAPLCSELYVCGGGALNQTVMEALRSQLPQCRVASTEELGIPAKSVEGAAFAWLAQERLHGRAAVSSSITGALRKVCLGGVYQPSPENTRRL
ncbi:MAG: anhydro-N-acetylmuramic acid kinase [Gammaproteobacteria bacterium]|jgi:anhydro-N-acetylmuramic acid kinase